MSIAVKPGSNRQLENIRKLREQNDESGNDVYYGIKSYEVSKIISELVLGQNGASKINERRLEMAMKECFRLSTAIGRDIWNEKRKAFIDQTIRTYYLFAEIAERLQQNPNT